MQFKDFLVAGIILASLTLQAADTGRVEVPRLADVKLKLDGIPNEPFWKKAAAIREFATLRTQLPAKAQTTALFCVDRQNFYIALICDEPIKVQPGNPKKSIWGCDNVEIFFAGLKYPEWYRHIVIGPGNPAPYLEFIYPQEFQYRTHYTANRWTAELVIPVNKLGNIAEGTFRFNLLRWRNAGKEQLTWQNVFWGLHPHEFGYMQLFSPAEEITHGPWLCSVTRNSAVIRWETAGRCAQTLYYRPKGSAKFIGQSADIISGTRNCSNLLHTVFLNDLKSGCEYEFHIREGENRCFRTLQPAKADFSFCLISDFHSRYKEFQRILERPEVKQSELMFLNGDMVTGIVGRNVLYDGFLDALVKNYHGIYYYLRGNHESRGNATGVYFTMFTGADRKGYCAFTYKGIFFVLLDTDADMKADPSYIDEQEKWFMKTVGSKEFRDAEFRILINHLPLLSPRQGGGSHEMIRLAKSVPASELAKFNLMLSGHIHSYARIFPGQKFYSTSPRRNGTVSEYPVAFPIVINTFCGLVQVRKTAGKLTVTGFDINGKKIESFTLPGK